MMKYFLPFNQSLRLIQVIALMAVCLMSPIHVLSASAAADVTGPTIRYSLTPAPVGPEYLDYWHRSDVTVTFTCTDNQSGVAVCPAPAVVSGEGYQQYVEARATDVAGNVTTIKAGPIHLDKTNPVISARPSLMPNGFGWYTEPVPVIFECDDALSGLTNCPAPTVISTNGTNQSLSGVAYDRAGNFSQTTIRQLKIDTQAPPPVSNLKVATIGYAAVQLSWQASVDNASNVSYDVYRNNTKITTTTNLSITDGGLNPAMSISYTVIAVDAAGNQSAPSSFPTNTTWSNANTVTVYYATPTTWNNTTYVHYSPLGSAWTAAPGLKMEPSTIPGYHVFKMNLGLASKAQMAFNNGGSLWDNNRTKDYLLDKGVFTIRQGKITAGSPPIDTLAPGLPGMPISNQIQATSVSLNWQAAKDNLAVTGYAVYRNNQWIGNASGTAFIDSKTAPNTTYTYTVEAIDAAGNRSVRSAGLTVKTSSFNTVKIYYKPLFNGNTAFIHYKPTGGTWTKAPGIKMSASEVSGYYVITLNIGTATGIEAVFNNGAGIWDNNAMRNYFFTSFVATLANGTIKAGTP